MNTLEQLKTALGEPLKRKIGGQEFEFYPLDVTSLPDFFELYLKLGNEPEKEMFKRENAELFTKMIMKLLKNSFPKDTPEEDLGRFAMKYLFDLQDILVELHTPNVDILDEKKRSRIEELKARILAQKNVKSAPSESPNLGSNQPAD